MPKAVMFDCYNTLLRYESEEEKAGIWKMMKEAIEYTTGMKLQITPRKLEALYKAEYEIEEKECISERGVYAEVSLGRVWLQVLTKLELPKKMAEEKAEDMLLLHRLYARKEKHLFPNVQEELLALKEKGMKLLLLSNAQNCFIYNEFPVEIRKMFDVVIISEEVGIKKPAPEVFGLAFEKLDMKPEDTVFVGDSLEDDMIPAGKSGCHCVMIGKEKKENPALSHVIHFNPYKESGYTGLAEIIAAI